MNVRNLIIVLTILVVGTSTGFAQTENVLRVNFLNPALSFEKATGNKTTLETSIGFGYHGSYPELRHYGEGGFQYLFAMFADVQGRYYYNFEKRAAKGKRVDKNNGNFIAARMLYTSFGVSELSSFERYSDHSFAVGPIWGLQRTYGERFNMSFSAGPVYYFDPLGNGNFFPLMLKINLGVNLN